MGSLGCGDDDFRPLDDNANHTEPLNFDSQFPPFHGECDGDMADAPVHSDFTVPYDDTLVINDALETQLLNFDGETQMMNLDDETDLRDICGKTMFMDLGEETQVMDIGGETEVCDYTCTQDIDTQLLDEFDDKANSSDAEDTDLTEILSDAEGSTRNEEVESTMQCQIEKGSIAQSVPSADNTCSSAPMQRGFTHIRVASIRAVGLAAHSMGSKVAEDCYKKSESRSSELQNSVPASLCNGDAAERQLDVGATGENQSTLIYEYRSKVGSKVVRKLFMEEVDAIDEEPGGHISDDAEAAVSSPFNGATELAGLSYVDSQEPGELSQATALEFVDNFLKVNVFDLDLDTINGVAAGKKPNPLSRTNGTQYLAKKSVHRSTMAETSIFDWDNSREDEGGGEFFCRKKDILVGATCHYPKSRAVPSKPRNYGVKEKNPNAKSRKDQNIQHKLVRTVHSDSKFALQDSSVVEQLEEMAPNTKVSSPSSGPMEAAAAGTHMPGMLDVGYDTQMAAEAMETLSKLETTVNGSDTGDQDYQRWIEISEKQATKRAVSKQGIQKRVRPSSSGVIARSDCPTSALISMEVFNSPVALRTRSKNARKSVDMDCQQLKAKRSKFSDEDFLKERRQMFDQLELKIHDKWKEDVLETRSDEQNRLHAKAQHVQGSYHAFSPIAWRTRQGTQTINFNGVGNMAIHSEEAKQKSRALHSGTNNTIKSTTIGKGCNASEFVKSKDAIPKLTASAAGTQINGLSSTEHIKYAADKANEKNRTKDLLRVGHDLFGECVTRRKRSRSNARKPVASGQDANEGGRILVDGLSCPAVSPRKSDLSSLLSPVRSAVSPLASTSLRDVYKSSDTCMPPVNCQSPINAASPVCMGNEYYKQSCKNNLSCASLIKELRSLTPAAPRTSLTHKDSRKRRDMTSVRVFFSRHLDEDVTKQQKKILVRLGASLASSISEATHFITDKFVRTRNMLEAIASGKPVVTDLWLESCGQASCFIDEKNYILRDAKKEKEIGFSMPVTLARALQHPLLKGRRVLITPSTKPGVEIISSFVTAVHGLVIQKLSRSLLKDDKLLGELLVLSCEDDYRICLPLMEKGVAVYSSELLLNGIVTQKLEYGRYVPSWHNFLHLKWFVATSLVHYEVVVLLRFLFRPSHCSTLNA
ncbi:hypothetical protein Dimus_027526 [Dionaea muscipula]